MEVRRTNHVLRPWLGADTPAAVPDLPTQQGATRRLHPQRHIFQRNVGGRTACMQSHADIEGCIVSFDAAFIDIINDIARARDRAMSGDLAAIDEDKPHIRKQRPGVMIGAHHRSKNLLQRGP